MRDVGLSLSLKGLHIFNIDCILVVYNIRHKSCTSFTKGILLNNGFVIEYAVIDVANERFIVRFNAFHFISFHFISKPLIRCSFFAIGFDSGHTLYIYSGLYLLIKSGRNY